MYLKPKLHFIFDCEGFEWWLSFYLFALCMKVLHDLRCDIIYNNNFFWQSSYHFLFVVNAIFSMKSSNNCLRQWNHFWGFIVGGILYSSFLCFPFFHSMDEFSLFCYSVYFSLLIELHLSKYSLDIKPFSLWIFPEINPHVLNFLMWSLFHLCWIYSLRKLQNTIVIDA